jgi:integrase
MGHLAAGVALRVQPSGHCSYVLVYRFRNRPRWYHLGATNALPLAEARRLAAELMLQVIRGKDPAAEKRAERGAGSFATMANRYLEEHAKRKNKSWRQADALIRRYVLPTWGELDASAITRSDMRAVLGKINGLILANQVLAATSAIFTWAVAQELLPNNPCRGVARNPTMSRERVLSDTEVPMFWRAFCDAGLSGVALQVLLLTGQRPGEVANMRWEHLADGWWTMPGATDTKNGWPGTKNGATHRVWLPQQVRQMLAELGDDVSGLVLGQVPTLAPTMRLICRQLKTERATPHDLRRTHGSTITSLGFGRDSMNRIQNHREGGIADVYDRHEYAEENKRVMEAVAARLLALAQGTAADSNVVPLPLHRST